MHISIVKAVPWFIRFVFGSRHNEAKFIRNTAFTSRISSVVVASRVRIISLVVSDASHVRYLSSNWQNLLHEFVPLRGVSNSVGNISNVKNKIHASVVDQVQHVLGGVQRRLFFPMFYRAINFSFTHVSKSNERNPDARSNVWSTNKVVFITPSTLVASISVVVASVCRQTTQDRCLQVSWSFPSITSSWRTTHVSSCVSCRRSSHSFGVASRFGSILNVLIHISKTNSPADSHFTNVFGDCKMPLHGVIVIGKFNVR
mmetsp:Transcript_8366/g.11541  ORF Transcript_8366/g.11541 Transcript_8366/m.11541 type:complete len:258 (-) Transcript_8366:518-1291(-)